MGSRVLVPGEPVLMMEVTEIACPSLLLIKIAQGYIEPHPPVPHGDGIEHSRRDLKARVEVHGPLDDVSVAARLRFCDRLLHAGKNPLLVGIPRAFKRTRFTF